MGRKRGVPRFKQITTAAVPDGDGYTQWTFALDRRGRVWFWREGVWALLPGELASDEGGAS